MVMMISHAERLLQVFKERRPIPYKLEVRPTKRCNLRCRHCWSWPMKRDAEFYGKELSRERCVDAIREAGEMGVIFAELVGGGEPTFDSESFRAYVREIKNAEIHGDLVTNGTRFSDDMIREMVEMGWDRIMFSIDGANARTHDFIRGKGVFKKATTAIKRFTYWKRKLGLDKPFLGMIPVLTNRNHRQFRDFLKLARRLGVEHVAFKPLVVSHDESDTFSLAHTHLLEMNTSIQKAIPLAERYEIDNNFSNLVHRDGNEVVQKAKTILELYEEDVRNARKRLSQEFSFPDEELGLSGEESTYEDFSKFVQIPCFMPWYHITITPHGEVSPCTGAGALKNKPDLDDFSLREALEGETHSRFRDALARGKMPEICKGCCVGLFMDNRRVRSDLLDIGRHMLKGDSDDTTARVSKR